MLQASRHLGVVSMIWLAIAALAGCSNKQHEEVLAIGKCIKASKYLEDGYLDAAAEYRVSFALKNVQGGAKYAMEVGQEIRDESEPQGASTSVAHVLEVAQKWKNSSYCKQVESDFATHIDELAKASMSPVPDKTGDPSSCQKYVAQFEIYTNGYARQYHQQLGKSLRTTLEGSLGRLKDFQRNVAQDELAGADFGRFALEMYDQCKKGGALSEKIAASKEMQTVASPTTVEIQAFILEARTNRGDCGEFAQDYCKADMMLVAAETALDNSVKCDQDTADNACAAKASALIEREFQTLEKAKLLNMQEKYQKFVADPEKYDYNAHSNIDALSEKCKRGAIDKGLRDTAYSEYVKAVCLPQARKDFLQPQTTILARIKARLAS